jgi:hypothetical protein
MDPSNKERHQWTHNKIQTNQPNPLPPDSKGGSKIAREKSVNVSGGSKKNKVEANRAAVSKAAAKAGSLGTN